MSVHDDRRDAKSQRIPFEAIVELGGDVDASSAFEAQGVDLSNKGMHLRTAYLPEVGQPLLCRFGSGAQDISAEAEVMWRREGARGGEFGVRFTNLDGVSEAALCELCGVGSKSGAGDDAPRPKLTVDPGTRVRLHIDGLGSPMKARVRGSTDGELLVGSNLEFLRVGRVLELEDVDRGGKRPAHIDRVDVELDEASRVPQLVVTLRYDDGSSDAVAPSVRASSPALGRAPSTRSQPEIDAPREAAPSAPPSGAAPSAAASLSREDAEDLEAAKRLRSPLSAAAADMMPKVAELGSRAKTTFGLLLSKTIERSRGAEPKAPRRTTAPPPSGALHAAGKRVVRGEEADDAGRDNVTKGSKKMGKKSMVVLGGTAGVLTVVTAMALHKSSSSPPGATAGADTSAASDARPAEPLTAAPGAVKANVPLFGPTTLSTTEPVTAAAPVNNVASAGYGAGSFGGSMEAVDDRRPSSDRDRSDPDAHNKVAPFGHGKVSHATLLRLKTDGEITAIQGARAPTGFSVTIPGRRAMDNGAALAAHDPRIASVRVSNGSKGAELTFQFKDGTPPYVVRAKGHDLQIALGRPSDTEDAKEPAKHGATAQKRENEHRTHRAKKD